MSIIRVLAVCLIVACGLGACTQEPLEPSTEEAKTLTTDEEVRPPAVESFVAATPEMRQAALSGDPAAMADAAAALIGCPAPTTCTGYSNCSTWSAPSDCEAICGWPYCDPIDPVISSVIRDHTLTERVKSYRVCSNSMGQSCTEWKVTSFTSCGC
jgi:hypothetical protein